MMIAATLGQALVGIAVGIPSLTLGYFGYRHSQRVDQIAEQAGIATRDATSIGQVIDGLNKINDSRLEDIQVLREQLDYERKDNRVLRENVRDLNIRLDQIIAECEDLRRRVTLLSQAIPAATDPLGGHA